MHLFSGNTNKVIVPTTEVDDFMASFPCSGLRSRSYWFEFEDNGDLIDTDVPDHEDGPGATALADDARTYWADNSGQQQLINDRIAHLQNELSKLRKGTL